MTRLPNLMVRMLFAVALMILPFAAALAADQAGAATAPTIDTERAGELVKTLEDPEARAKLIDQLKALSAADDAAQPAKNVEELGFDLVQMVTDRINALALASVELSSVIVDLPDLTDWLTKQVTDPEARQYWINLFTKLAVILGFSIVGHRLTRRALKPTIDRFYQERPDGLVATVPIALLRGALRLIPIVVFAAIGYGLLFVLGGWQEDPVTILGQSLVNATIFCLALVVTARTVLAPAAPDLRLVTISDSHARYIFHWIKRFIYLIAYSYVVFQNEYVLEIPASIYGGINRALGLIVVLMLVYLVLRNRKPVAHWLRGNGESEKDHVMQVLGRCRRLVADIWPVFAIFYIVSTYLIWALAIPGGFALLFRGGVLTTFLLAIARPARLRRRKCARPRPVAGHGHPKPLSRLRATHQPLSRPVAGLRRHPGLFRHSPHAGPYLGVQPVRGDRRLVQR